MGWFEDQGIVTGAPAGQQTPPVSPDGSMPLGSAGMDPQAYFNSLFPGDTLSPQDLAAKEAQLKQAGIRLLGPNAKGQRTKIELPNGQIIDVIGGAGAGKNRRQWLVDSGGGAPGGFQMGTFTGGGKYPLASVMGPGLMQPWTTPFERPNPEQIANDPSFKFQMQQGLQALQRSAAAKGTLLTGGTLKDMNEWAQGLASTFDDKYYNRALGEYNLAYGIYDRNQANQYGRLSDVAGMGANTAGQYGIAQAGLTQNAGDATAAGQAGSANAWSNAVGNAGNIAGGMVTAYPWFKQPGQTGGYFNAPVGQSINPNTMFPR